MPKMQNAHDLVINVSLLELRLKESVKAFFHLLSFKGKILIQDMSLSAVHLKSEPAIYLRNLTPAYL